jgi:primosomal protein N' (replication factor Y)
VLLNRRGWSNFLSCRSCGKVWGCPECDVALVLHRAEGVISCHHCGHRERVPDRCDACGSTSVARHGLGTERLEHELVAALGGGDYPIFRLDADVAGAKGRAAAVLARFERAPAGVLVGTQMVAKGHDFDGVALGVVLDADATLRFPDFRAEERTFALVTQLAGRAGGAAPRAACSCRRSRPRLAASAAARHDSEGFLAGELRAPPGARLSAVRRTDPHRLLQRLRRGRAGGGARAALASDRAPRQLLGPAPLFRLRGRERAQLVVKAADRAAASRRSARPSRLRCTAMSAVSVDVDPQ